MRRIVKAHLNEFKEPQCKSDYCQYCYDLDAKVIPKMVRLMNKGKAKLSELMPCYFAAWEVYEKKHSLHHRPGLHLELFCILSTSIVQRLLAETMLAVTSLAACYTWWTCTAWRLT